MTDILDSTDAIIAAGYRRLPDDNNVFQWLLAEARWWAVRIDHEWGEAEGVSFSSYYPDTPMPDWLHS